ncbi:hypothetical protein BH23ACT6_BH23ACT6_07040 [soil metagenome]
MRAGNGECIVSSGVEHLFAFSAAQTGGALSVETFLVPPGRVGAPPHTHRSHDECFVVLVAELTVVAAAGEHVLRAGDTAYAPRGSWHRFRNAGAAESVKALCMSTPAGYEQFFRDVQAASERGDDLDADALAAMREGYDTSTRSEGGHDV